MCLISGNILSKFMTCWCFLNDGNKFWAHCSAIIKDERAPNEWNKREPSVNYTVYYSLGAVETCLARIDEQKAEIKGLAKRHEIERSVYERVINSLVVKQGLKSFEEVVARLEKIVERLAAK